MMRKFLCAFLLFGSICFADHTETVTDPNTQTVTSSTYDDFDHLKIELVTYSNGDTHAWWRDTGETLDTYAGGGFEYTYANGDPSVHEVLTKSGNTWTTQTELGDGTSFEIVNPSGAGDVEVTIFQAGVIVWEHNFESSYVMVDSAIGQVDWADPFGPNGEPIEEPFGYWDVDQPSGVYLPPIPIGPAGPR